MSAGDTVITHIGNLTATPELRFTPAGVAVASFTVAATPRVFDRATNGWKDGAPLFLRCNLWREAAENLADSDLPAGARVIVSGRLKQRSYETREGEKRSVFELEVDEVGPSLRWATAKVNRKSGRSSNSGNGFGRAPISAAVAAVETEAGTREEREAWEVPVFAGPNPFTDRLAS
ncbi:single-stranded DNA-binding protein [Nocardia sp. XZ_19_385]|uniref:single-stranded DNA-binding protein n=1 Tax=Nocardia sp. XZ_19_385 TaxID=2769488 RepID=UPI00188FCA1D|nr:single-stranded DNA-binding protein [Nocardia sp. XZ_19_385]